MQKYHLLNINSKLYSKDKRYIYRDETIETPNCITHLTKIK